MAKAALQNLGCSKNQVDGERILEMFRSSGHELTEDFTEAEIIVVNTCAFIQEAQEEAIENILEAASWKSGGKCKTLIVSGCFSERYRDEVSRKFPEVDLWVGVDDWPKVLAEHLKVQEKNDFKRVLTEPRATQYIKIAEGCSHKCTFCVIPSIRGIYKSRTVDSIVEEAQWLYENDVRELILVAQDTSFYGKDLGTGLINLLETVLHKTDFKWIRMMYLYPHYVTDELLRLMASEKRICPYFDIPLQHSSESILKAMNRPSDRLSLVSLIDRIRKTVPDAGIRSAFILGFPGETEKDFKDLLDFTIHCRFDKLGVFPFSPEKGTKAYEMEGRPRKNTVQGRCEELMAVQREISSEILESKIGREMEIIIDRVSDDPDFNYEARSRIDAPEIDGKVLVSSGDYELGSFARVKIIGSTDYDLYA